MQANARLPSPIAMVRAHTFDPQNYYEHFRLIHGYGMNYF